MIKPKHSRRRLSHRANQPRRHRGLYRYQLTTDDEERVTLNAVYIGSVKREGDGWRISGPPPIERHFRENNYRSRVAAARALHRYHLPPAL